MQQFIGIADAHGIESFISLTNLNAISVLKTRTKDNGGPTLSALKMRAIANRHRHAVLYKVSVSQEVAEIISDMIDSEKYKEALIFMKQASEIVEIVPSYGMKNSWALIPNDILDPYWNSPEKHDASL